MEVFGNPTLPQKFYCELCDHYSSRSDHFAKHLLTRKHEYFQNQKKVGEMSNLKVGYSCIECNFHTSCKRDYDRHITTNKHKNHKKVGSDFSHETTSQKSNFVCTNCDSTFLTHSGLWKHKNKCVRRDETNVTEKLLEYIEKRERQHDAYLEKKDHELKNLVIELCKSNNAVTNNINNGNINSNNNNKTFNLQLFLNETCKDALNLSDFIKSIKVSVEDLESIGSLGYVDGTSNVIIKHLNNLGVEKRPIQCTDAKRQTLYVKENDEWFKEDTDFKSLHKLVDEVQKINLRQLPLWRETHPNCLKSNSIHTDTYNTMSQELMGGFCTKVKLHVKDNKIINKIIKEVVIDKQLYITK